MQRTGSQDMYTRYRQAQHCPCVINSSRSGPNQSEATLLDMCIFHESQRYSCMTEIFTVMPGHVPELTLDCHRHLSLPRQCWLLPGLLHRCPLAMGAPRHCLPAWIHSGRKTIKSTWVHATPRPPLMDRRPSWPDQTTIMCD